jgi:hypothetical protein
LESPVIAWQNRLGRPGGPFGATLAGRNTLRTDGHDERADCAMDKRCFRDIDQVKSALNPDLGPKPVRSETATSQSNWVSVPLIRK